MPTEHRIIPEECRRTSTCTRFMRREWKRNKPHLRKVNSLPTLSLLPSTRPHFECRRCGFINTLIPMCLWCCWTSKEAETRFEKSMPRARRVSAPMRIASAAAKAHQKHRTNGERATLPTTPFQKGYAASSSNQPGRAWDLSRFRIRRGAGKKDSNGISAPDSALPRQRSASCSQPVRFGGTIGQGRSGRETADMRPLAVNGAQSCLDLNMTSMSSRMDPVNGPVRLALFVPQANQAAPPSPDVKNSPLVPLRLRRLKETATPLYIDPRSRFNSAGSASSPNLHAAATPTKRPSPSPKIFHRMINLRRPSKWSHCISDVEDDSPEIPTPSSNWSPQLLGTDPFGTVMTPKKSPSSTILSSATPLSRKPMARQTPADPFGELREVPSPSSTSTMPPSPTMRHRAATVSGTTQFSSYPVTPTSPRLPLYSGIRKDGVCLSPLPSPTRSVFTSTLNERLNVEAISFGTGNSPQPSFTSWWPSDDDSKLLSLSLESRPVSSAEASCGGEEDAFTATSRCKGPISKPRSKPQHKRRFDKSKARTAQTRPTSRGSVRSGMEVSVRLMGKVGTMNSNPTHQRMLQVSNGLVRGPAMGCSMSGETELKLALRARSKSINDTTPNPASAGVAAMALKPQRRRQHQPEGIMTDVCAPVASLDPDVGTRPSMVMRKLREMVSRTFHG